MYGYVLLVGSVVIITCLIGYNLYYGIRGDLKNAKEGEVYHFRYLQPSTGDYERHMVKVLKNITLTDEQIQRLNARSKYRRFDNSFRRTNHLVTGQSANGQIRNFYAERVDSCRKTGVGKLAFTMGIANLL
jgi:hypothetical protein